MFFVWLGSSIQEDGVITKATRPSKLFSGSSEFGLTYEDKEGDWMLVGDVPWVLIFKMNKLREV